MKQLSKIGTLRRDMRNRMAYTISNIDTWNFSLIKKSRRDALSKYYRINVVSNFI